MTKLSHSQISKYQLCAKSYEYHYVHKIRSNVTSAALLFGSALDAAVGILLAGGDKLSAEVCFEQNFTEAKINNTMEYLPTCTQVVYSNTDFDSDILTESSYTFIKTKLAEKGYEYPDLLEAYKTIKDYKQKRGLDNLSAKEKTLYALMNWSSSMIKGKLMIEAYIKKVIPKIEKVHSTQEYVSLKNEAGDSIIGYVDLVADVKGVGTVILDNKTSAREYEEDSVLTSPQLALYVHMLESKYNTRRAGYIVLRKMLIKNRKKICSKCGYDGSGARHKTCSNIVEGVRCNGEWTETIDPEVMVQFITDEIPEQTEHIVLENTDTINESIKHNLFPRNLNSCTNYFGGNCPYLGLCYKKDMTGLIEINKQKE